MRIQRTDEVSVQKTPEGDERHYHIQEEFEIIEFVVPPNYEQPWHRHEHIWESVLITEGQIVVKEGDREETISEGDTYTMTPSEEFHTIENRTDTPVHGVCFKLHPSEKSNHELFANDKILRDAS